MFYAKCFSCESMMKYARKNAAKRAEKNNQVCKECKKKDRIKLERDCPGCGKLLKYKATGDFNRANKNNSYCASCAKIKTQDKNFSIKCLKCNELHYVKWEKTYIRIKNQEFICKKCKKEEEKNAEYSRNCFECGKKKIYKNKYLYNSSIKKYEKIKCSSCISKGKFFSGLKRKCPKCNAVIKYLTNDACTRANKDNSLCKSCSIKEAVTKDEYRFKMIESGRWSDYFGLTLNEWSRKYDVPSSAIESFINIKNLDKERMIELCKEYERSLSSLENIIQKELDISFFNKKIIIEEGYRPDFKLNNNLYLNVDGLYWHSKAVQPDKKYHFNMRKAYEENDMRIIQVRSDEIHNKFPIVKSIIDNAQGNTPFKVGARKTEIKKVTQKEATEFLLSNHMMGTIKSNHFGLYYKDELLSLMSYKSSGRKDKYIKIDRFCSKINYNIMGGFSKLLKKIEEVTEDLPIHYWVDLRYGTGKHLLSRGFLLDKETLGWKWTDFKSTYNRLQCRANMDERGISQAEHAEELGWVKIYDAGQRLYIKY